jgi:hypothetical protein
MGNPKAERDVFEAFLQAAPTFAGAAVANWSQPTNDPPDIEAELVDGRKVGIDLTSWLDESQIGLEKKTEFVEMSLREAIQPEPPNETEHIFNLWMTPKRHVIPADRQDFRTQLLALTEEIDKRWESEPAWQSPQGFLWTDFTRHPMLAKYLESVDVHPRRPSIPSTTRRRGLHWLTFPMRGGAYAPGWMAGALCECVQAKIAKYAAKPAGTSEFHLLAHYDKAFAYNTPVQGIDFGYADAAKVAAVRIGASVGVFDKIFVFVRVTDGQQVFQLYP